MPRKIDVRQRVEPHPYVISVDWMAWTVRLDFNPVEVAGDLSGYGLVTRDEGMTASWGRRLCMYTPEGDKVATLLMCPRSNLFRADQGLLEVANRWLYVRDGWIEVHDRVRRLYPCWCVSISRVDVAIDFVPNMSQRGVIDMLAHKGAYVGGKRAGSDFWSIDTSPNAPTGYAGRRFCHCMSWGHKTSKVRWKLYYKSKELAEPHNWLGYDKPYIVDVWRDAGLDVTRVWRLEVSVHHSGHLTSSEGGLPVMPTIIDCERLICAMYNKRFVVRREQGHLDSRNDSELPFLCLIDRTLLHVSCRKYDGEAVRNDMVTLLRKYLDMLKDNGNLISDVRRNYLCNSVLEVVKIGKLQAYAHALVGEPIGQYIGRLANDNCVHSHV